MIKNLEELLLSQKRVLAFNIPDSNALFSVLKACQKEHTRCIVQFSQRVFEHHRSGVLRWTKMFSDDQSVDFSIFLDHCISIDTCKQAVDLGFNGVLFDGSRLSFRENVEKTSQIVRYAHAAACWVEGEINPIPGEEDGVVNHEGQLSPVESVVEFIEKTRIDMFAPYFGNIHGDYGLEHPGFYLDYVCRLRDLTSVPFVIHGGSGMPLEVITKLREIGFSKFNVSTDLKKAMAGINQDGVPERDSFRKSLVCERNVLALVRHYSALMDNS